MGSMIGFLRNEGWAEELDRMSPEDLTDLADQPYARKPMKLTKRSAWH